MQSNLSNKAAQHLEAGSNDGLMQGHLLLLLLPHHDIISIHMPLWQLSSCCFQAIRYGLGFTASGCSPTLLSPCLYCLYCLNCLYCLLLQVHCCADS
jgi:hypothetical protein